jgi:YVTN family beta-propeller protein
VAFAPDGRTLLVTAEGSNAILFVDQVSGAELARTPVGDGPRGLVLDRTGQRAFVLDRRSNALHVVDVPNRAVVATVATDPLPTSAAVSRDNSRLYLVSAGSASLSVYSLPTLAPLPKAYVGLGARAVLVDSKTDLVYVGGELSGRLLAFDAYSLIPVDQLELPGEVGWMCIADADGRLFALLRDRREVAVIDLVSRAVLATIDVGKDPYQVVVAGQRR